MGMRKLRVATCQFLLSEDLHGLPGDGRDGDAAFLASFVARPDATIAEKVRMNQPGMLVHDFPDGLSQGGWLHNDMPLRLAPGEPMLYGRPTRHPRQLDARAEP